MAVLDEVVLALLAAGVAGDTARLAQAGEALGASGEDLVHVCLVTGVPEDRVAGGFEHAMQGDRQLDGTEISDNQVLFVEDFAHWSEADAAKVCRVSPVAMR